MPALLVLIGLAAAVVFAASGHSKKPPPHGSTDDAPLPEGAVELDRAMPSAVVDQVLAALAHDKSAAHLETLAHNLSAHYPLSATALRERAATLHGPSPTEPRQESHVPAPLPSPSPPVHAEPPVAHAPVASAPMVAPEPPLPAPAPTLTQTEATLAETAPPSPAPVAHAQPPTAILELQAATVLQAAMRALVEEADPVVLEGFAESIRTPYPTAATLLLARAHAMRGAVPHPAHDQPGTSGGAAAAPPAAAAIHASATAQGPAPSPMESHA